VTEGGDFGKFTVLKNDDIQKYAFSWEIEYLDMLRKTIKEGRVNDNKSPDHKYIVINTDEPYADEIIEILKKHGHWG